MGEQDDSGTLGAQISEARRARGMTQQELADAVGVDRKTVNRWETGRSHGLGGNYAKLAEALDWPPEQALRLVQGSSNADGGQDGQPSAGPPIHPLAAQFNRLLIEGAVEEAFLRSLMAAKVTVVGVSATGSSVPEQLAHMGAGNVDLVTDDPPFPDSFMPARTRERVARLLDPDGPLDRQTRETLAALIGNACDLVDPPPAAAKQLRDEEALRQWERTAASLSGPRREPSGDDLPGAVRRDVVR